MIFDNSLVLEQGNFGIRRAKNTTEFFYCTDGETVEGPVYSDQLFEMYKAGRLTTKTQICAGRSDVWMTLNSALERRNDLPEFAAYNLRRILGVIALWFGLAALCIIGLAVARALSSP
jgi:hypothetical protein